MAVLADAADQGVAACRHRQEPGDEELLARPGRDRDRSCHPVIVPAAATPQAARRSLGANPDQLDVNPRTLRPTGWCQIGGMTAPEIAAYYFPNYHRDARNEAWHGPGWTEWELVKAARPRWEGHRQPIVPAWGHFDESDPAWAAREIDLAADHGITSFIFDWYWHEQGPYLHTALEDGFLRAANRKRMRFALMWANHDWTNIHPAQYLNQPAVLAPGAVTRATWEKLTDHVVEHYFSQPNYLTIAGRPYFSIYEMGTFIRGLGGIDEAVAAMESFRTKTRRAGFPDLHLNVSVWSVQVLPSEHLWPSQARLDTILRLNCASVTSYCWVHHLDWKAATAVWPHADYQIACQQNVRSWHEFRRQFPVPYHPNVSMGWDPSPRTTQTGSTYADRGYPFTAVLEGNTPAAFGAALESARDFLAASSDPHPMLTLNAWNEWTEGSYLLPGHGHWYRPPRSGAAGVWRRSPGGCRRWPPEVSEQLLMSAVTHNLLEVLA